MSKVVSFEPVLIAIALLVAGPVACSPKVGSDKWCEGMKEKPKGDWTANEASDYMKYCVLGVEDEDDEDEDEDDR